MKHEKWQHKKWFWGLFFLLAAVFVIASQTGSFLHIGFLSIVATVLLASLVVQSIADRSFFGVFFSAALLYLIYQKPLNLPVFSFWLLLLTAILAAMGCHILFRKSWSFCHCGHGDIAGCSSSENLDGEDVFAKLSFGQSSKYLHSRNLKSGKFKASFGEMEVYFDQAQISPDGANIEVECSFGQMELYIPRQWQVVNRLESGFGSVDAGNSGFSRNENDPVVTLTGGVSFGNIEIHPV